jgi:hypothetical protein
MLKPSVSLEALLMIDLIARQRVKGQAIALILTPPTSSGQGEAPHDRFIFIEQDELVPPGLLLQLGQSGPRLSELIGVGLELAGGAVVAEAFF